MAVVRFLARDLAGWSRYDALVGVNSVFTGDGVNRIRTRKVLVSVELSE